MSQGRVWTFVLPYERPPLSANRRKHWAPGHREYRETKSDAYYLAKYWQQQHDLRITPGRRVDVLLTWYPGHDRVADSDNISDTLKPILDGLTLAKVWPDDRARYVRRTASEVVPHSFDPEQRTRPTVTLEIREVDDGGDRHGAEHADGGRRSSPPERPRADQADRALEPVPPQRNRRGAARGHRRYGHQRHVGR